jgi:precorrin-2 dehydrogenase / sirohydrochlorin ferrochelatase
VKVYPIFLNLVGRPCLVVGGGAVGERKVKDLLQAGALVTVVSRELTPTLNNLVENGDITYLSGDFRPEHLTGMVLVIGATNDAETNRLISKLAQEWGLLINIVDAPELGNFNVPATLRRGELTVAVGTGGVSPALAKKVRRDLEQLFGPQYGPYLEILGKIRDKVLAGRRHHSGNAALFTALVQSPLYEALTRQDRRAVQGILQEILGDILPPADLAELLGQAWGNVAKQELGE